MITDEGHLFIAKAFVFLLQQRTLSCDQNNNIDQMSLKNAGITGSDILHVVRLFGGAIYGLCAPLVFKSWGIESDEDVNVILEEFLSENYQDEKRFFRMLLDGRYYRGKTVLEPVTLEQCSVYGWFFEGENR